MTASGRKIRIAEHIEIEWLETGAVAALCPNCEATVQARRLLDIDYRPPDARHRFILQICPECTVRFVDNAETMDYGTELLIEMGWNIYQVQLGAGVWPISAPLTRVAKPAGAKALEIGGAFGFGLDFGVRARGWAGVGFDPSPLAKFGARELGLELRQDYFAEKNLALGPWDVAIATEVLEHLPHPPEFLRLMRQALKADGILVLTTPDAAFITPELPAGTLMPLLSPGAHIVLQTAQSLEVALRAAGFAHVQVRRDGLSLVAYASGTSFALNDDGAAGRSMYRTYLVERAALAALTSDLRLGYAGRGIFEAVNDGDWDAADAAWEALLPAAKTRFGLDLQSMSALPPGAAEASLAELCRMMPLGLGMILFGRAMRLLQAGQSRAQVEPVLRLAAEAVDALLRALAKHSLQDGLSASLAGLLRTELLMCAAAAGRPEVVTRLSALGDEETSWRCFVELVNAGEMSVATALREVLPELPSGQIPAVLTRDALLSLVNFHLAPGGDAMRVLPYVAALKAGGNNADAAILGAFTRLVNAQRFEDAKAMRAAEPILRKLDGLTDEVAEEPALGRSQPPFPASTRDALFAAGILFLQEKAAWQRSVGVFARLREAFVRSSPAGTVPDPLFWPALRGEVIALQRLNRGAEAVTLLQSFLDAYPGAPEDLREQAEGVKS
jgi:SAM-dependent methyltransferase